MGGLLFFLGACLIGCARVKGPMSVRSPLVTKYFQLTNPDIHVYMQDGKLFAVVGFRDEKIRFQKRWIGYEEIGPQQCPELDELMRMKQVKIADATDALNVKSLWQFLLQDHTTDEYVVEDVTKSNGVWVISSKFYGLPEDGHRRDPLIVHEIGIDEDNVVQNVSVNYPLRTPEQGAQ